MKQMKRPEVNNLYLDIARECFDWRYPEMDEARKEVILNRRDLDEIEGYTPIKKILDVAIRRFRNLIYNYGVMNKKLLPPDELRWRTIVYSENPEDELAGYRAELYGWLREYDIINPSFRVLSVYELLKVVHEEWMRIYEEAIFFKSTKIEEKCRFMPFELIGYKCAVSYLLYIEGLLSILGWTVDREKLRDIYGEEQDTFLKNEGLIASRRCRKTRERQTILVDYLMHLGDSVPQRVAEELAHNRELATLLAYS